MLSLLKIDVRVLLATTLLISTGCAGQLCRLPDDCAVALSQATIGWRLRDFCEDCPIENCLLRQGEAVGCGVGGCAPCEGCETGICDSSLTVDCSMHVYEDEVWIDGPRPARRARIKVGPRPVPFEPPMPPQFLLVPTSSQQCVN